MEKLKTEDFVKKARKIHGDKYDYSKVDYKNIRSKICIICPEHGEFWQTANDHLKGCGCFSCGQVKKAKSKTLSTEDFVKKARKIHGDKYDYSKVDYVNARTDVCIVCPEHGEFWQKPYQHLNKQGCPICGKIKQKNKTMLGKDLFVQKAIKIHGHKYDYSKVNYINNKTEVCIICPEHGEFWQRPDAHLHGQGCFKCQYKIYDKDSFLDEARKVHGDKYDYSKVKYIKAHNKVCIICPNHGEFWQTPSSHIHQECGCPTCSESKLEKATMGYLTENNIKFEYQKRFNWLVFQSLDFYLPDYNIAIECQGIQHFQPVDFGGNGNDKKFFEYIKNLDKKKNEICSSHNIKIHYVNYNEDVISKLDSILEIVKER